MRTGPNRVFLIVVLDEDRKTFELAWMTDDRQLNERVVTAQNAGRNVRCFSASSEEQAVRELTTRGHAQGRVALGPTRS
jgi:hypothetical protein